MPISNPGNGGRNKNGRDTMRSALDEFDTEGAPRCFYSLVLKTTLPAVSDINRLLADIGVRIVFRRVSAGYMYITDRDPSTDTQISTNNPGVKDQSDQSSEVIE